MEIQWTGATVVRKGSKACRENNCMQIQKKSQTKIKEITNSIQFSISKHLAFSLSPNIWHFLYLSKHLAFSLSQKIWH